MRFKPIHALSFSVGFLSLSQEILWFRFVGFTLQGAPQAFAFTLAFFLLGIAAGAIAGRRLCEAHDERTLLGRLAGVFLAGAALDVALPYVCAAMFVAADAGDPLLKMLALAVTGFSVALTAGLKGTAFPIVHHLGTRQGDVNLGRSVSLTYFSNILGSAIAPLVTGFVVLDLLTLQQAFVAIATGTFALALVCAFISKTWSVRAAVPALGVAATLVFVTWRPPHELVELVALRPTSLAKAPLAWVSESRHGVIHTIEDASGSEIVFGGNVYDGRLNTSLHTNSNRLHRAFYMATMHEAPRRVLVIGLSGGAWLSVLLGIPGVETVDVVEINPAFARLIEARPEVARVLLDPRVSVHYDDGRRWLRARPKEQRYDLVLMNTTFHWRNYAANLLSAEFLTQIREHLAPGGAVFYNSTDSPHALAAAQAVFSHAYLFGNFIAASDADLAERRARLSDRVWQTQALGRTPFSPGDDRDIAAVNLVLAEPLRPAANVLAKQPRVVVPVTDMNLNTEYRYGRSLIELRSP